MVVNCLKYDFGQSKEFGYKRGQCKFSIDFTVIVNYYLTGSEKVKLIVFEKFDDQWTPIVDLIKCGFRLYGLDCIIERLRTYLLPYR